MTEATKPQPNGQLPIIHIKGMIRGVYEHKKNAGGYIYETIVVIPNPDEYGSPLKLTVKSNDKELGKEGEMINVKTRLSSRYWKSDKDGKVNYSPELWLTE
jgi:hypothetical protein